NLADGNAASLFAFHWHPFSDSPETGPHFHMGERRTPQAERLHVPTKRITVEEFIALAIGSFGAHPVVEDAIWRPTLVESQRLHEEHRTWSDYGEFPRFPG